MSSHILWTFPFTTYNSTHFRLDLRISLKLPERGNALLQWLKLSLKFPKKARMAIGPIETLFLRNLKSLNFGIWTRPSKSTSKIIQKPKIWGDFQKIFKIFNWKFRNFHAWLRKNCWSRINSDWRIWKRASRSRREGIMKVY